MKASAQRTSQTAASNYAQAEIDQLNLELSAFNNRIAELETSEVDSPVLEALRASAILLAREIDELRCTLATKQLASLLAK
jgi:hypothetical protein